MKMRLLFILIFSFIAGISASAQNNRTVTNEDLEKFRQKRLAAERDYRENYEKMGFPSPEELEKQIEQGRVDRANLATRLRTENLEREQLDLQRQIAESEAQSRNLQIQLENSSRSNDENYSNYGNGFYGFPSYGYQNNRLNRGGFRGNYGNGYRGNFRNQPRIEYRNNLPVIVQPPPPRILAPRQTNGGRRN